MKQMKPSITSPKSHGVLTKSETDQLLRAIADDPDAGLLNDVVTLILNMGLRAGELRSLLVKDVDLEKRSMRIGPSKTRGWRYVPFTPDAAKVLSALIAANPGSKVVLGAAAVGRMHRVSRQLARISLQVLGRSVSLQTLRYTFATNMINAGMKVEVLARLCGCHYPTSLKSFAKVFPPDVAQAYREAYAKLQEQN